MKERIIPTHFIEVWKGAYTTYLTKCCSINELEYFLKGTKIGGYETRKLNTKTYEIRN